MSKDDKSREDTVSIVYYYRDGREREEFAWFKGEQVPVHYSYTYDRRGRLKTQVTDFRGNSRYRFHYRRGRLCSVMDYDENVQGRWEKTGVTIWKYDGEGRVSRIFNPPKWPSDYTRTFAYDTLGRETENISLDEYGKVVYRCRILYDVHDVGQLIAELDTASLSAIHVENNDEHGRVVERYELIKGKVNSHERHSYDDRGRLRTTIGLHTTTRYAYCRLPRKSMIR